MFSVARRSLFRAPAVVFRAPTMALSRCAALRAAPEHEIGYTFDGSPNHHSDAEALVDEEPIVYVKGHTAICRGGESGVCGCPRVSQSSCFSLRIKPGALY
jgi:hypothetical protein